MGSSSFAGVAVCRSAFQAPIRACKHRHARQPLRLAIARSGWVLTLSASSSVTMSSVSSDRLNGSVWSESKCRAITLRSIVTFDPGRITGFCTPCRSDHGTYPPETIVDCLRRQSYRHQLHRDRVEELIWHFSELVVLLRGGEPGRLQIGGELAQRSNPSRRTLARRLRGPFPVKAAQEPATTALSTIVLQSASL